MVGRLTDMLGGVKGSEIHVEKTEGSDEKAGTRNIRTPHNCAGFSNADITQHNVACTWKCEL